MHGLEQITRIGFIVFSSDFFIFHTGVFVILYTGWMIKTKSQLSLLYLPYYILDRRNEDGKFKSWWEGFILCVLGWGEWYHKCSHFGVIFTSKTQSALFRKIRSMEKDAKVLRLSIIFSLHHRGPCRILGNTLNYIWVMVSKWF